MSIKDKLKAIKSIKPTLGLSKKMEDLIKNKEKI